MKLLLISALTLTSITSFATILTCTSSIIDKDTNSYLGVNEKISGECRTISMKLLPIPHPVTDSVNFEISGKGLGFKTSLDEKFIIDCPMTSVKSLVSKTYVGSKVNTPLSPTTSLDVGLFSTIKGSTCLVNGISLGLSRGGHSVAKLNFSKD